MSEQYDEEFWADVRQRAERVRSLPVSLIDLSLLDPVALAAMPTIRRAMRQLGIVPGATAPPAEPPARPWKRRGRFRQRRRP